MARQSTLACPDSSRFVEFAVISRRGVYHLLYSLRRTGPTPYRSVIGEKSENHAPIPDSFHRDVKPLDPTVKACSVKDLPNVTSPPTRDVLGFRAPLMHGMDDSSKPSALMCWFVLVDLILQVKAAAQKAGDLGEVAQHSTKAQGTLSFGQKIKALSARDVGSTHVSGCCSC